MYVFSLPLARRFSAVFLCKNSQKTIDFSQWMNGIASLAILHPKNA